MPSISERINKDATPASQSENERAVEDLHTEFERIKVERNRFIRVRRWSIGAAIGLVALLGSETIEHQPKATRLESLLTGLGAFGAYLTFSRADSLKRNASMRMQIKASVAAGYSDPEIAGKTVISAAPWVLANVSEYEKPNLVTSETVPIMIDKIVAHPDFYPGPPRANLN